MAWLTQIYSLYCLPTHVGIIRVYTWVYL